MARTTTRPAGRLPGLADTLAQHGGFADVVAALHAGHGGTIGGTWGSASALTAAALANQLAQSAGGEGAALVVVLPHADEADAFSDDLELFTTRPVMLLPALESLGDESLADDPAAAARLAVVKQLAMPGAAPPAIVVTSIQALLAPLADPREIEASTRRLEVGGRLDPLELADWLAA
ncbi:MAG: hypothetical protein EBZ74_09980, partial [Planctomycetia bacterium]|nr:hypothetical protein [Planctomycetia bacterium]